MVTGFLHQGLTFKMFPNLLKQCHWLETRCLVSVPMGDISHSNHNRCPNSHSLMSWAVAVALWQERVSHTDCFCALEGQKDSHVVSQPSAGGHGLCSCDNPVVPALGATLSYK